MILDAQVSLFQGSYDTTPIETLPLSTVLQRIQAGTYRLYVEYLRHLLATKGEKAYKHAKEQSLAFTPCCAMHTRAQKVPWGQKLISITGLVHLDCDDLDDPEGLKAKLAQQPTVRFAFVSPKGNGLKIGIAATGITDPKSYKHAWTVVSAMIQRTYPTVHVSVDEHVKYLNALCYVSYDPLLYMNGDAIPFVVPPPTAQPAPALRITDDTSDYSRVASAVAALRITMQAMIPGWPWGWLSTALGSHGHELSGMGGAVRAASLTNENRKIPGTALTRMVRRPLPPCFTWPPRQAGTPRGQHYAATGHECRHALCPT